MSTTITSTGVTVNDGLANPTPSSCSRTFSAYCTGPVSKFNHDAAVMAPVVALMASAD